MGIHPLAALMALHVQVLWSGVASDPSSISPCQPDSCKAAAVPCPQSGLVYTQNINRTSITCQHREEKELILRPVQSHSILTFSRAAEVPSSAPFLQLTRAEVCWWGIDTHNMGLSRTWPQIVYSAAGSQIPMLSSSSCLSWTLKAMRFIVKSRA